MERVNVYTVNKTISCALLGIGVFFLITGLGMLINTNYAIFKAGFSLTDLSQLLFILQGFIFIFLGYINFCSRKYYVQWDDHQLTYHLPESMQAENFVMITMHPHAPLRAVFRYAKKFARHTHVETDTLVTVHLSRQNREVEYHNLFARR